jgi:hypothetical protein
MSTDEFCTRLDSFLGQLPKDFQYVIEIRNAGLRGPDYRKVLATHGVGHVYNHWSYMPPLADQQMLSVWLP